MKPQYKEAKVTENIEISKGVYKLTVYDDELLRNTKVIPGQFYMLKCWESEPLLPRPISVCSIEGNKIIFLYTVIGKGTALFASLIPENTVEMLGPLGNGFDVDKIKGKVAVVAGGIGIAPMVQLVRELTGCEIDVYAGFRSGHYATDYMKKSVNSINVSTEDGSEGYKGYVTDLIQVEKYEMVLCCGPEIMMEKVLVSCRDKNIPIYVSMEKHMACGVGACLVCTCKTKNGNKRTCKDGPVFLGDDIVIGG